MSRRHCMLSTLALAFALAFLSWLSIASLTAAFSPVSSSVVRAVLPEAHNQEGVEGA